METLQHRILRLPAVEDKTGIGKSAMYAAIKAGTFPKPIKLGSPRSVGWLEREIDEWIVQQVKKSRGGEA